MTNRIIKFRAWDRYNHLMIEDFQNDKFFGERLTDDLYAVMQFTGLLDKNGKEIYEGDIVKYPDGVNKIGYEDGSFVRYFIEGGNTSITQKDMSKIEIIGNIYENPINEENLSPCCSGKVVNGFCSDCKEHV